MTKKENKINKEIDDIAKELNKLYDMAYEIALNDYMYITENKITDADTIEHCFDKLLEIPTQKGYILLLKLYNYYRNIDLKTANFYLKDYIELYDIRELPINKTKKKDYKKTL